MENKTHDLEMLKQLYQRVVEEPNKNPLKKACIRCPECGEEILVIPSLKAMGKAIEAHVTKHKEQLKAEPVKEYQKALIVRLSLVQQVIDLVCQPQIS